MAENQTLTRRGFVRAAILSAVGVAAGAGQPEAAALASTGTQKKRRYGMLIDLRRCVGCESCTIACKAENNIGVDSSWMRSRRITWNQVLFEEEDSPQPDVKFTPRPCNHCDNPPCVKVCPVGATYKDEGTGIVMQNYDRCIGCRYCTVACPYTARYFNWEEPSFPHVTRVEEAAFSSTSGGFNPLVPVRTKGLTEKCVFCVHRIKAAEEQARAEGRELRDGEVEPACVTTCISQARVFGDLNDPDSRISRLLVEYGDRVVRLQEHLGTGPNVYYLPED